MLIGLDVWQKGSSQHLTHKSRWHQAQRIFRPPINWNCHKFKIDQKHSNNIVFLLPWYCILWQSHKCFINMLSVYSAAFMYKHILHILNISLKTYSHTVCLCFLLLCHPFYGNLYCFVFPNIFRCCFNGTEAIAWLSKYQWRSLDGHGQNRWLLNTAIPNKARNHDDVNIFRVTGHLWGEFTGRRWIPRTKASDAELWCFLWSAPE